MTEIQDEYKEEVSKILNSDDPNQIYEMEFNEDLCDSSLYKLSKNPEKSVINWSYTFDLYCDKETYITVITSIVFIGGMIGTVTITPLLDKYGRSLILKICVSISLILHLNLLFCVGPIHLIIINFLGGIILGSCSTSSNSTTSHFPSLYHWNLDT